MSRPIGRRSPWSSRQPSGARAGGRTAILRRPVGGGRGGRLGWQGGGEGGEGSGRGGWGRRGGEREEGEVGVGGEVGEDGAGRRGGTCRAGTKTKRVVSGGVGRNCLEDSGRWGRVREGEQAARPWRAGAVRPL